MNTAYSYVRFSSKGQEKGDSVRRQMALARAYAAKQALTLDERSYEDLGISAFKGRNLIEGALGAFIKAVDGGLIQKGSYLLVESLDRVSRAEILDALDTFMGIVKRGIVLVTLNDEQQYTRSNITENWTKLIMALAVMARANEESATKSRRVKEAWDARRASGLPMTAMGPAWLELKGTKWVQVKDKVKVVRRIFELAAKGLGTPTIAERLNKDEVPTLHRDQERRAELWTPELVMALLRNRAVIGDLVSRKTKTAIEGYYGDGVVKRETFDLVLSHISKRRRTGGPKGGKTWSANLLSGRLFCVCGSKMRYVSSNPPNYYVRCLRAYAGTGCEARAWNYGALEGAFLEWLFMKLPDVAAFTETDEPDHFATTQAEIAQKEKALGNLIAVAAAGGGFSGGVSALATAISKHEQDLQELRKTLLETPARVDDRDYIDTAMNLWDDYQRLKVGSPEWIEVRQKIEALARQLVPKVVLEKQAEPLDMNVPSGAVEYGTFTAHLRSGRTEVSYFHLPPKGFQPGNVNGKRPTAG